MNPACVNEDQAYQKMIADLTEMTISHSREDFSETRNLAILDQLKRRIAAEPARIQTDIEGRITSVNPAFIQLCGHNFEELKGRKPGAVLQGPESSPESVQILREAIRNRVPCETELVNYHKNSHPYRVKISLRPMFSNCGELTGFEAEERQLG